MTKIEIYPDCKKPDWVDINVLCRVWGEGEQVFTITKVLENSVILNCSFRESFSNLKRYFSDEQILDWIDRNTNVLIFFDKNDCTWNAYDNGSTFLGRAPSLRDCISDAIQEKDKNDQLIKDGYEP